MAVEVLRGNQEIADYLGVALPTFMRNKKKLGIPTYKFGNAVCARKDSLDRWIREHEGESDERVQSGSSDGTF